MSRPPLYSRAGATSPTMGADINMREITEDGAMGKIAPAYGSSLLVKAQEFSVFAVQHVEEVHQALVRTSEANYDANDERGGDFRGRNGAEITAAFKELTAAYDKLSSLKWDAARMEFEETHQPNAGMRTSSKSGGGEKGMTVLPAATDAKKVTIGSHGVKADPWQGDDEDDLDPHHWISDAFLKEAMSEEDDVPVDGRLASLNASAQPLSAAPMAAKTSTTPPGFEPDVTARKVHLNDDAGDGIAQRKPMQSFTSIASEISSLHTSSHPYSDDDDDDEDDDYSDDSSSSEELPSIENFDYVYKGGFAMQVSGGKETKGVVPKTVKRVLVDPSVKNIEEGAFQGCMVLQSITIPSTVESVGSHSFRKCAKLRDVTFLTKAPKARRRITQQLLTEDEKKEEKQAYRRTASAPSSFTEPRSSSLRSIGEWAFFNCSSLGAVDLPHALESIGTRAFQRCSSMSMTQLPKTLVSVGEHAFVGCPRETKAAYDRWEKERSN